MDRRAFGHNSRYHFESDVGNLENLGLANLIVTHPKIAEMQDKYMYSLRSHNQRSFAAYLNIYNRLVAHLHNERCKSKHTFWGRTMTDEQFGQIINDLNFKSINCCYWTCEGIFLYFSR